MAHEAMVHRKLVFADGPAMKMDKQMGAPRAFVTSDSAEKGAWTRFKTAARELVEDARDTIKRAKKGLEPISKVEESPLLVPAEVVIGQFGPAIISRRGPG